MNDDTIMIANLAFDESMVWLHTTWLYWYNMQYCLFGGDP